MSFLMYGQMKLETVLVTPKIAEEWLKKNTVNRALRKREALKYSRDMAGNEWERIPVAVCFDEEGNLGNGQHRLNAIILSGIPQDLLISWNTPRKAIAKMDAGIKRTISDIGRFIGEDVKPRYAAVTRIVEWGPYDMSAKSFDELFEAYQEHFDVIDFVIQGTPKCRGLSAGLLGVCARAIYTHERDKNKIKRFIHLIATGLSEGLEESSAILLRNFVNQQTGIKGKATQEIYQKTESALSAFLVGKYLKSLRTTKEELFPLPTNRKALV